MFLICSFSVVNEGVYVYLPQVSVLCLIPMTKTVLRLCSSATRLGDFCTLGNHSKPVATIILTKSPTLLVNVCYGVKLIHIFSEIIFGQLLWTVGDFYLVTLLYRYMGNCSCTYNGSPCHLPVAQNIDVMKIFATR